MVAFETVLRIIIAIFFLHSTSNSFCILGMTIRDPSHQIIPESINNMTSLGREIQNDPEDYNFVHPPPLFQPIIPMDQFQTETIQNNSDDPSSSQSNNIVHPFLNQIGFVTQPLPRRVKRQLPPEDSCANLSPENDDTETPLLCYQCMSTTKDRNPQCDSRLFRYVRPSEKFLLRLHVI
jgi:hypothetical protein